jgi:hypothetical protein
MMAAMLINKRQVRRFLLDCAHRRRPDKYTRVAPGVYAQIEAGVQEHCRRIVQAQPSLGKTIR